MYKEESEKMVVKSNESMEFCESVPVDFMVNLGTNHGKKPTKKINKKFPFPLTRTHQWESVASCIIKEKSSPVH